MALVNCMPPLIFSLATYLALIAPQNLWIRSTETEIAEVFLTNMKCYGKV